MPTKQSVSQPGETGPGPQAGPPKWAKMGPRGAPGQIRVLDPKTGHFSREMRFFNSWFTMNPARDAFPSWVVLVIILHHPPQAAIVGPRHEDPPGTRGEKGGQACSEIMGLVSRDVDRSGPQAY